MGDVTDPRFRREERLDDARLIVTRKSTFTHQLNTMTLPITADEWAAFQRGDQLIQDALPRLTNPQREFLMTGTTQGEWDAVFADQDDEDDL